MKFKDYVINGTWTKINGKPMLKILDKSKKVRFIKFPFRPYFFITKSDYFSKGKHIIEKTAEVYKIDYEIEFADAITADTKEFAVQISTLFPSDVKKLRLALEGHGIRTYEADIPYFRRCLLDLPDSLTKPKKILYMDIEVDAREKFSEPELAENRIISIGAVDYKGREFFFSYDNEAEMIADFFDLAKKYELLIAWNANYDITYLANRAKKLGLTIGHVLKRGDKTYIFEHPHLDLQKVFKNIFRRKVRSYALKAVAKDFLGKQDVIEIETREDMIKLWESFVGDKKLLREYNLQDCWLLKEIDEAANLLDIQYSIVELCSLESYEARGMGTYVDSYMLKIAKTESPRVVFPTKSRDEEVENEDDDEETYRGGLVENRSPGLHRNVILLDISSTYPAIIRTFNIGLETFREKKWEGDIVAPHGSFVLKKESVFSRMVDALIALRKWAKENRNKYHPDSIEYKIWDGIQFSYKFIVNAIYGYLGFEDSRAYRRELAENVTLLCRAIIRFVDEYLRNNFKNLQVIYLDSVHPSVCIPIIVGDKLLVEPIESIWNQFAKNVVVRPDGKEEFYPENMYTFTRKGIRKVKRIIRHKCSKECVLLRARPGAPFVTKDHSIIVNGREVTPLELVEKNLEPDSIKVRWSPKSIVDEIDVLDYIDRRKYKIIFSNDKLVIVKSIKGPKRYKIPRKIKLNREFGYVLGAYISEGSVLGKKGQVRLIGARSKDFVETVYTCATKVFGKENVTFIRTGRHVHLRKVFAKMFEDLCGRGAENKRLPYFFFNAPKEFQEALVEAYIRGDGKEEKYGCSFGTTSRTLASQLAFYFKLCGHGVRASAIVREEGEKLPKGYVRKEDLIEYKVEVFYDDLLRDDSPWKKLRKNEILYTDTPEYVYDLEVEDDHTFIDALGCIVLHNTDGLYVKLPDNLTKEQIVEVGQYLVHKINDALKKWIPMEFGVPEDRVFIEIKLDRAAYTAYFPKSKKRYSLFCFYEDGQFADYYHIKGFGVKSNMPELCKEIQRKVLEMILNEKPSSEIVKYLKEVRERLFKGELDDKLVMYITLRKDPSEYKRKTAHVVVAEKLKKMGIPVAVGDKIAAIPLGSVDDYIPYIPGKTKLTKKQYELFWNNYVISALEQLDLDESILSKVRDLSQKSLSDFFS